MNSDTKDTTPNAGHAEVEDHVVVFRLGNGNFALDIRSVEEIVRLPEITKIPESDPAVEGVTNLRGRVVPVIDLRRRCRMPETAHDSDTRVIVVTSQQGVVGLIVDAVSEVLRIPIQAVDEPGDIVRGEANRYVTGVAKLGERLICQLDLEPLITPEQLAVIDLSAVQRAA